MQAELFRRNCCAQFMLKGIKTKMDSYRNKRINSWQDKWLFFLNAWLIKCQWKNLGDTVKFFLYFQML